MVEPSPEGPRTAAPAAPGRDASGQPGVIGIGLAAVLTFALAQGSWEWFSAYIGVTLLAIIFSFCRTPAPQPGQRTGYALRLAAFSLVVGLCAALALAPALQRWSWLFPMSGARTGCPALGRYEGIRAQAALGGLADLDSVSLSYARHVQTHTAVADCLAHTTTRWLPVYGAGVAVAVGLGAWLVDRARTRRRPGPAR